MKAKSRHLKENSPQLLEKISGNPWDNAYWFARMLIASDKYGGIGTDSNTMNQLSAGIRLALQQTISEPEDISVQVLKTTVEKILNNRWRNTKKATAVSTLTEDLSKKLLSKKDFEVLALTCEKIIVPINMALQVIPNNDRLFAESVAFALLTNKGEQGLSTVINLWDDVGSFGCIAAERAQIVNLFGIIRQHLDSLNLTIFEKDIILTSFCQEFERRVGQKRKGRAGRGLESVTSFILDFYKVKSSPAPEHFTTGLEIDRWVKNKEGWYIGISCKRTLRERWKQTYTTDLDLLNRHKIKALWHVLTFDRDLSDDKLTEMGSHRAILYLPDDSPRYQSAKTHPGMADYVRPLTVFIKDLRSETNK